jgi:hypothetical protein
MESHALHGAQIEPSRRTRNDGARNDTSATTKRRPTMADRPIIMTGESVRAILDGRKTQTRRVVKPQPPQVEAVHKLAGIGYNWMPPERGIDYWRPAGPVWAVRDLMGCEPKIKPTYCVGDRLWVKETFALSVVDPADSGNEEESAEYYDVVYRADSDGSREWTLDEVRDGELVQTKIPPPWRSPIHMPRWASRITLEVTAVRVQRLHDMPREDVYAEGISEEYVRHFRQWFDDQAPWMAFAEKWDTINRKRAPWSSNPWVWAITFRTIDND